MTVIRPNSISGINSITANGGDINLFRADGTAGDLVVNNVTTGVITATTFSGNISGTTGTFTGNLGVGGVLTYEDVTNIDSVGVITARSGIRIAAGSTVGPISGIVTYFGDGSQLTGIDSTALSFGGSVKIQANASGTIHSGMTTATGGVTIPASTTLGLDLGDGTNKAQLAMQSGVANRIALRTTYSTFGDNNPFIIYQPSSAGVQNDALVVHASGIVMKSKHPMLSMTVDSNTLSGNYMTHNSVLTNNGGHYNTSTSKFVCPVAGFYFASIMVMSNNSDTTMDLELHKNNSNASNILVPYQAATGNQYNQVSGTCIVQCSAGDDLRFKLNSGSIYGGRHSNITFALFA